MLTNIITFKTTLLECHIFDNNQYLDAYISLIFKNIHTKKLKYITQKHHVFPKNIHKYIISNIDKEFTINLKYSDHILAHYYLCLCSNSAEVFAANFKAIKWILQQPKSWKSNSDLKQKLSDDLLKFKKNLPFIDLMHEKVSSIISEKVKASVAVYKDNIQKRIPKISLDDYLAAGWIKGILPEIAAKRAAAQRGRKLSAQARLNIAAGHRGKPSGMKGKKFNAETLKLLSEKHSGKNNGMYGKKHSENSKRMMAEKKKTFVTADVRENICIDYKSGKSINKIRTIYKMSAKKILRILFEENLITISEYQNKYKA